MSETEETHMCQVPGCNKPGDQFSLPDPENLEADVFYFYCHEHAHENGFCWSCGGFFGGNEEFEFSKLKLCRDCEDSYLDEFDEDEGNTEDLDLQYDGDEDEAEEQEPKPLMRCRTCKFKFNQRRHTTYEDSEQHHVKCPKCGRVYVHSDIIPSPEHLALDEEFMDCLDQARDAEIAAGMQVFTKPTAIKTENVYILQSWLPFSRTYYENLPREDRIKHCQKCYEYNLEKGNVHLADFWKKELEKAKEGREN